MNHIKYFDVLRSICFLIIVFFHMMMELQLSGVFTESFVLRVFSNSNIHIVTISVATFFILSGASLAYTSQEKFNTIAFYKKRFLKILIPFYLTMALCYIGIFVLKGTIAGYVDPNTPLWHMIFTVLGIDSFLTMYGVQTFSLGIGEWFLGCLITMYYLYPLLRYIIKKYPRTFFIIVTILYILYIMNYNSSIAVYQNPFIKLYEFIIGIYIGFYFTSFPPKLKYISIPISLFFLFSPVTLPIHEGFKITVCTLSIWCSISFLEPYLQKRNLTTISTLSNYSYEVFLIHHFIISLFTPLVVKYLNGPFSITLLFLTQLTFMAIGAITLKTVSTQCANLITKVIHS